MLENEINASRDIDSLIKLYSAYSDLIEVVSDADYHNFLVNITEKIIELDNSNVQQKYDIKFEVFFEEIMYNLFDLYNSIEYNDKTKSILDNKDEELIYRLSYFCMKNNFFAIGASCIQYFGMYINIGLEQIQQDNPNYNVKNISDIIYNCIAKYDDKYLNNIENIINIVDNIQMLSCFDKTQKLTLINKIISDRNLIYANNLKYITDNSFMFEINRNINYKLLANSNTSSWKTIKSLFGHVINTRLSNYHDTAKMDIMTDFVLGLNNIGDNNLTIRAIYDILLEPVFKSRNHKLIAEFYGVIRSIENCIARDMIEYEYNKKCKQFLMQQESLQNIQQVKIVEIKEANTKLNNDILQSIKAISENELLSYAALGCTNKSVIKTIKY